MNIAVVDDLAVGRETLVNYLNEYFSERNMNVTISDFSDAESFVTQFENNKYNMIFFDIYMPGMSGIEAASTVRKTDSSVEIIFLSTSNNFACESYSVNAFCYLVKPITKDAVESLMQRYFEKYEEPSKSLSVLYKTKPEIKLKIAYDSIMYIDVTNRKVRLHLKDKTIEIQNTFSQCASILTEDSRFSNCCKGFIVNFDYVNTVSGNDFLMQNGDYVPIKKRENQQVKKQYLTYELTDIIRE